MMIMTSIGISACSAASVAAAAPMRFQLAGDPTNGDYVQVAPGTGYDEAEGYGYEPDASNQFSVRVPTEGNYRVRVTFVETQATGLTIKAETRRLMVERAQATAVEPATATFLVNVRSRAIGSGGDEVRLGERDRGSLNWDDKLTLEFLPSVTPVRTVEIVPATDVTTIYIAGDSTVADQRDEPYVGWGQMLPRFFNDTVAVANHAESGRALRSFRAQRRFDKIISLARPGDYVFIQFGHNDMKEKGEGIGAMTSFKADLESYVREVQAKGATPVLVTSMYRRRFSSDGKLQDSLGDYPRATRAVAAEQNLTLIDLHEMSGTLFTTLGEADSKRAFLHYPANTLPGQSAPLKDDSHFSAYGGYELARCVVEGIRTSGLKLADQLSRDVTPFDPAKPDDVDAFNLPASVARSSEVPEGR
ncbi:MAG TPA: rhamnogalacturonan acetylesterase [Tepidisphaeraceae bacterium]|nr:rhamnogalacturonan acetylesterase [Tepidisphaeraceae bacterium]